MLLAPVNEWTATDSQADFSIDVVIVTYNARELVEACLRSLMAERVDLRFRIIVVDNASSDGVSEVMRNHPAVELIQNHRNLGFGRAANIGLRQTHADYVLLLNPDTVVLPGSIRACTIAVSERPNVGILGCKLLQPDGTLDHACKRDFPTPGGALRYFVARSFRRRVGPVTDGYTCTRLDENSEGDVGAVNGAFMLFRRTALDEVGAFDEAYWMYGEDLDLCYRFWQTGWRVTYWPGATITHVKAGTTGRRRSIRVNYAFHYAMWLFYRKHYASMYSPVTAAVVWAGVWLKFAASVASNARHRAVGAPVVAVATARSASTRLIMAVRHGRRC